MVNRKTITANTETDFELNNVVNRLTVKNFTTDYIYVAADSYVEAEAYKIPSMTAQTIKANTNKVIVKAVSAGEVEIDA